MDNIRCPVCRGARKIMKLGAILGKCDLCKGKGEINECDRPKVPELKLEPVVSKDFIAQVSKVVPVKIDETELLPIPKDIDVKIDGKKAIYKRKAVAK